ncbi:uncharacterized protein MONBRDRAFT_25221 [Monosiga brevicollis MX1]|uniref:SH2 domain-containing protein n=1 Tax=Monosiga brevicollis TaxID=81824 RepID=A9UYS0_MONBE|nr:uncharacterized protein MONBRDRAFT_25221 [Monosiga brevicollis MX1]EDQ89512.1 predicted protein [Monosiga brevicollis MX1]|eukprot:XP_001745541.1 hypothetical protein [Monosiga brevicollis MX1]
MSESTETDTGLSTRDPEFYPRWYHGVMSRRDAEMILAKDGIVAGMFPAPCRRASASRPCVGHNGTFLVRASTKGDSFVLSACSEGRIDHYQIEENTDSAKAPFLQFRLDTGMSPKFRSLSSVLHYLLEHPHHLPFPLRTWVERETDSPYEYDQPSRLAAAMGIKQSNVNSLKTTKKADGEAPKENKNQPLAPDHPPPPRRPIAAPSASDGSSGNVTPPVNRKEPHSASVLEAVNHLHWNDDSDGEYVEPQDTFALILTRVSFHKQGLVRDSLASVAGIGDRDLLDEHLYETVQRHPSGLDHAPEVLIHCDYEVFATDANTGEQVPLSQSAVLKLITLEKDEDDKVVVVCRDNAGRKLKFNRDSNVEVIPAVFARLSSHRSGQNTLQSEAPSVPERPSLLSPEEEAEKLGPVGSPAAPGRRRRNVSLSDIVKASGKQVVGTLLNRDDHVFYRDVLREGYLSKLPPRNNRVQGWKRRWFKLVVSLDRSLSGGPVYLEYYTSHLRSKPKGVIDLDKIRSVGPPSADILATDRQYRNVPKLTMNFARQDSLFEVHLPRRTYRLMASSRAEARDWMSMLEEVIGLEVEDDAAAAAARDADLETSFFGHILNEELSHHEAQIKLNKDGAQLIDPTNSEVLIEWKYSVLRSYGYIGHVCWFEAGRRAPTGPGIMCFSVSQSKQMFDILHALVTPLVRGRSRHRRSQAMNMSWASLEPEQGQQDAPPPKPLASTRAHKTRTVFGQELQSIDLEPVALAVPTQSYDAVDDREYSFAVGDVIRVLGTRAFTEEGYWLCQKENDQEFGLVKMLLVQVHEHEFGNFRDMDDITGSMDSLADLDENMFNMST